jgi:2-polyprenyl-3-methyl-5-hydroxy-6-metoxy-1,4-benzoquinol methylase
MENALARGRRPAWEAIARGDATGWFGELHATVEGDARNIQCADMEPNPGLVAWLDGRGEPATGQRALVVGCGLGDNAELLSRRGSAVTAFDVAPTAIAWCCRRSPGSSVQYVVADLLQPPEGWAAAFDLVVEIQ